MVTEKPPRWARFRLSLFSRVGSFYNIINKPGYEGSLLESPPGPDDSLSSAIRASATDIETYATDILLGDFAVFECLDRVVKDRARQAAYAKWGERAREFGWQ